MSAEAAPVVVASGRSNADVRYLTLLQLNDLHGYLEPHAEIRWRGGKAEFSQMGGLARIATAFEAARRDASGAVVTLDNGDTFDGTYPVMQSRGAALVPIMNALKFDAMTAHWEFAWGPAGFKALAGRLAQAIRAGRRTGLRVNGVAQDAAVHRIDQVDVAAARWPARCRPGLGTAPCASTQPW